MTFVDRRTRCILSWRVVYERSGAVVQEMIQESVQGRTYYSDAFEAYQTALYWPADYHALDDKSETFSVEGDNADLRHYLARLVRRSRCFTRCIHALRCAVKLFVCAFNRRQLARHRFPAYPHHLIDFVYP
jgi:insertion element IS1 protein InsB